MTASFHDDQKAFRLVALHYGNDIPRGYFMAQEGEMHDCRCKLMEEIGENFNKKYFGIVELPFD